MSNRQKDQCSAASAVDQDSEGGFHISSLGLIRTSFPDRVKDKSLWHADLLHGGPGLSERSGETVGERPPLSADV